jgi:integrase
MSFMGWADTGMAKRYQHVTVQVRKDVATGLEGLLWQRQA